MALIDGTSTSSFLYCTPTPVTTTVVSTVYETVLPCAGPTGMWDATYTITDWCAGSCHGYTAPVVPPGFVVTTVHCPVCPTPEVEITCPGLPPTGTYPIPPPVVTGNGITATVTVYPSAPPKCAGPECPGASATTKCAGAGCPMVTAPAVPSSCGGGAAPCVTFATKPAGNNGTYPGGPIVVGGAPSVSRSLGLISGLAMIAGYVYLL